MHIAFFIAFAGAIGSVLRFLASETINRTWPSSFPIGTLTVNLIGCFLIGCCDTLVSHTHWLSKSTGLIISVGLIGGITTLSAFGMDTMKLLDQQAYVSASAYVITTVAAGLGCIWLGSICVRLLARIAGA